MPDRAPEPSVWKPPDDRPWGWTVIGIVFTAIQCGLIAVICAISWGRPSLLNNITASDAVPVVACGVVLLGFNIAFVSMTEELLKRRVTARYAAQIKEAETVAKAYAFVKPRWLAAGRYLEARNLMVESMVPTEPRVVEIPSGFQRPLVLEPPEDK